MCISWGHMRAHMPYIPQTSRSDLRDAAGRSELGTNLLQPLSVVLPVNRPAAVLDTARPLAKRNKKRRLTDGDEHKIFFVKGLKLARGEA